MGKRGLGGHPELSSAGAVDHAGTENRGEKVENVKAAVYPGPARRLVDLSQLPWKK
jgi:hypothetical protein